MYRIYEKLGEGKKECVQECGDLKDAVFNFDNNGLLTVSHSLNEKHSQREYWLYTPEKKNIGYKKIITVTE